MSVKVKVYNKKGEALNDLSLSEKVFKLDANQDLIHQALVAQMSNERQVLAHAKGRAEVRGGGKKPWRQKGTGRARAGSSRSPIWIGGGVTFGPTKERNYSKKINIKMKKKALMMILSDRANSGNLIIVDKMTFDEYKTKVFVDFLDKVEPLFSNPDNRKRRSILVVNENKDDKLYRSARNLSGVNVISIENVNLIDLLRSRNLLMSEEAIKKINDIYSKE